jgi:hypothetical protein
MTVDQIIRKELNFPIDADCSIYKTDRDENHKKISAIVNNYIEPISNQHDINDERFLKENGYCLIENLFSEEEIDQLMSLIKDQPGYNYHIAANSYNREAKVFSDDLNWNVMSYEPSVFLKSELLLQKITKPEVLSLIQSYLGCFPTMYSINCVWSKYTEEEFKTQTLHRDFDDYKFVSLFVYLTDIDDNNGPHMYYPKTHNGEDNTEEPVIIKGKKGTTFLADVYGLHNGVPLKEGKRCLLWCRFGLMVNNVHYKDQCNTFIITSKDIFDKIEDNQNNRYLLRAFLKD